MERGVRSSINDEYNARRANNVESILERNANRNTGRNTDRINRTDNNMRSAENSNNIIDAEYINANYLLADPISNPIVDILTNSGNSADEDTPVNYIPLTDAYSRIKYRSYTLHPNVDDYFYYNYQHYKTIPLLQKMYYVSDNTGNVNDRSCTTNNTGNVNGGNRNTTTYIESVIRVSGNIYTDVFIKLGQLSPACIHNISVHMTGFNMDNGIYYMNWPTVYLYNLRCHPNLVANNIFVIPNLTLVASTMYDYVIQIKFDYCALYKYVFEPWRELVAHYLPKDIGSKILEYLPNHITIDMWCRRDNSDTHSASPSGHSHIFTMLKTAFRNIYMNNYLIKYESSPAINIIIHKNSLQNYLLFTFVRPDSRGWHPLSVFHKLVITIGTKQYVIMNHELAILPSLYECHFIKNVKPAREYSIPSKFKLTEIITQVGTHPYMYSICMTDYLNRSLIMNQDYIEENEWDVIGLTFYIIEDGSGRNCKSEVPTSRNLESNTNADNSVYLYAEFSTK
jgi:hypothetical protein